MGIAAGRLDRQVRIDQNTSSRDAAGQEVSSWSELDTVRARRVEVRAGSRFTTIKEQADKAIIYHIRWRTDVSPGMRIVEGNDTFLIEGVTEMGRKEGLELTTRGFVS